MLFMCAEHFESDAKTLKSRTTSTSSFLQCQHSTIKLSQGTCFYVGVGRTAFLLRPSVYVLAATVLLGIMV